MDNATMGGWVNQAYSRLSTTHGHITDCKLEMQQWACCMSIIFSDTSIVS